MNPITKLRFRTNPPADVPPEGFVDLVWDPYTNGFVSRGPDKVKTPLGSSIDGISDVPGLEGALDEKETPAGAAAQIETALEDYLPLDGSRTMAGSLDLGNNTINNVEEINLADVLRFPFGSVHNGYLSDETTASSVDWIGRTLRDGAGGLALDWHQHLAFDSNSNMTIDWGSCKLYLNPYIVVDWANGQLFDLSEVISATWSARILHDSGGGSSVDWGNFELLSPTGLCMRWSEYLMFDDVQAPSLGWNTRQLFDEYGWSAGNWGFFGLSSHAVKTEATTVADLGDAVSFGQGSRRFVTDANSHTFHAVVSGGGSHKVPVFSDGTNWRIG
jgi:hypothetical protein